MYHYARTQMKVIMARMRVSRSLKHSIPAAVDISYAPGDYVLLWHEKVMNHRIGELMGPYYVT